LAVNDEELQNLRERHPALSKALDRLFSAMQEALLREAATEYDKPDPLRLVGILPGAPVR
jgi:hypothetical protein